MNKTALSPVIENSYIFGGILRDASIVGKVATKLCLFDTGASYCHMSFEMWKDLGFAYAVLQERADLFHH